MPYDTMVQPIQESPQRRYQRLCAETGRCETCGQSKGETGTARRCRRCQDRQNLKFRLRRARAKLEAAGYGHVFHQEDGRTVIDMHGIAVAAVPLTECCHGTPIDWNCNACSDEAARGGTPNPRG